MSESTRTTSTGNPTVDHTRWAVAWTTHESAGRAWRLVILAVILVGLLVAAVAQTSPVPNKGFADGAAVLAVVSLVAVGIERVIEMFWSVMTRWKSAWWPLNEIASLVDTQVDQLNLAAKPVFAHALAELTDAKSKVVGDQKRLNELDDQIALVQAQEQALLDQVGGIKKLAKDNQRVAMTATATTQAVNRIDTLLGDTMVPVRAAFNDATQVATGAVDIVAAFKDNPAKKMISIILGSLIGLVAVGFVGLDLFAAAGAPLPFAGIKWTNWEGHEVLLVPYIGVALTGLVLGLGSNPTHQVVSYVTDVAKARKAAQLGAPDVPGTADEGTGATTHKGSKTDNQGGTGGASQATSGGPTVASGTTVQLEPEHLEAVGLDPASLVGRRILADVGGIRLERFVAPGGFLHLEPSRITVDGEPLSAPPDEPVRVHVAQVPIGNLPTAPEEIGQPATSRPRVRPGSLNLGNRR